MSGESRRMRILATLRELGSRGRRSAQVLAAAFGVSARTIHRDVVELRRVGFSVESATGRRGGVWLGEGGRAIPPQLSVNDVQELWMLVRVAREQRLGLTTAFESLRDRLSRVLRPHWMQLFGGNPPEGKSPTGPVGRMGPMPPLRPHHLWELGEAVARQRLLWLWTPEEFLLFEGDTVAIGPRGWEIRGWDRRRQQQCAIPLADLTRASMRSPYFQRGFTNRHGGCDPRSEPGE